MKVSAFKTDIIIAGRALDEVLDRHLTDVPENSIVAITSKVAGICEGRLVPLGSIEKDELVKRESHYFLNPALSKYNMSFTVTQGTLVPVAGIDEVKVRSKLQSLLSRMYHLLSFRTMIRLQKNWKAFFSVIWTMTCSRRF
jgi:F420-0:gamma-glutamyl ligase